MPGRLPYAYSSLTQKSGAEFVELEPRMELLSEHSYNEEMRKHTLQGKLFAVTHGKNVNNRIAVFRW